MSKWSILVLVASCICGFVFIAAAVTSDGSDLRPAGGDLTTVLADRAQQVEERRDEANGLQREIDRLSGKVDDEDLQAEIDRAAEFAEPAGMTAVYGPGVRITLQDAPRSVDVPNVDPNLLVVHQQDIQAFVNALWAGGAEAVTLQGQRLVTTTGIKCVGNTVVLDGVPYAPPYVIEAIGNQFGMNTALEESSEVTIYAQYAQKYDLGLERTNVDSVKAPAYGGSISLTHAVPVE